MMAVKLYPELVTVVEGNFEANLKQGPVAYQIENRMQDVMVGRVKREAVLVQQYFDSEQTNGLDLPMR